MDVKNTKVKILEVSQELFSRYGLSGTSIRDISEAAGVNIAAVNYHFKNKENLYHQVFLKNYQWLADNINRIGEDQSLDTREFSWQTYLFFIQNSQSLLNTFNMFLNAGVNCDLPAKAPSEFGPPGQEAFLKIIARDVGEKIPFEGHHWAMRMIFSDIAHFSLAMSAPIMKNNCGPHFHPDEKKRSIYFLVEAILEYLTNHPDKWNLNH